MGHETKHGPVLVGGEPALVVDATAAALRDSGHDACTLEGRGDQLCGSLLLLVPAGAEAVYRAVDLAGRCRLPWGAVVDARADPRRAATIDALGEAGASWVIDADAGLPSVLEALTSLEAVVEVPPVPVLEPSSPAARLATLTAEERAVLDAMAGGRSLDETADAMGSTVATVRAHRRSVRRKLRVRSQLAAVALLFRLETEDGPYVPRTVSGPVASTRPVSAVPHLA